MFKIENNLVNFFISFQVLLKSVLSYAYNSRKLAVLEHSKGYFKRTTPTIFYNAKVLQTYSKHKAEKSSI